MMSLQRVAFLRLNGLEAALLLGVTSLGKCGELCLSS